MGNRTTAIKLKDGSVWVLPSTPLDGPTKAKLKELGPVSYILSGDSDHHMYLCSSDTLFLLSQSNGHRQRTTTRNTAVRR